MKGTATALITPFTNDGIDTKSFEKIIDFQLENQVDALVVLGTTGEPATMSVAEKALTIRTAVRKAKGKVPIIVGAGSNNTKSAIASCKMAQDLGADALLVVTPYYNKCTQDGLVEHYCEIANSTSLNIICYNVPSRTGVNLLPETFEKIAKNKNVVGIKEASGNMEQIARCIDVCNKMGKALYSGDDALTVPIMALGGQGVISVASNVCPQQVATMTKCMLDGKYDKAREIQLAMLPLISTLFCEVNPIPIKTAMAIDGWCDDRLRLPLTAMSQQHKSALQTAMRAFKEKKFGA